MPLSEMKNMLVEATGRYDLVEVDTKIGATFLLNAGQRFLDKKLSDQKAAARYFVDIDAGDIIVPLPKCRTVKRVYLVKSTERTILTKRDITYIRANYADKTSTLTAGAPTEWAICNVRPYPGQVNKGDFANSWGLDDIIEYGHQNFNAIVFMPPSDATYTIEVWGLFYSDTLVNSNDETYWTEEHPEILLKAALLQLESIYRNTEGVKDWTAAIDLDMLGILGDLAEQDDINEWEENT